MRLLALLFVAACQSSPATLLERFDSERSSAESNTGEPPLLVPPFRVYAPAQLGFVSVDDLVADLSAQPLVFFGERHATAPVQALEGWLLDQLLLRGEVRLAMEHFDRDVQPLLDAYAAGQLSEADFLAQSRPWPHFSHYWLPLLQRVSTPVLALNIPKPSLSAIYGQFPTWPLDAVAPSPFLPPLPLAPWTARYAKHFEDSFDYEAHGAMLGLNYADALRYFTELAHLRDATMAEPLVHPHTLVIQGEWHVQGNIATAGRVALPHKIVTTLPASESSSFTAQDRWVADYVLIYDAP